METNTAKRERRLYVRNSYAIVNLRGTQYAREASKTLLDVTRPCLVEEVKFVDSPHTTEDPESHVITSRLIRRPVSRPQVKVTGYAKEGGGTVSETWYVYKTKA